MLSPIKAVSSALALRNVVLPLPSYFDAMPYH